MPPMEQSEITFTSSTSAIEQVYAFLLSKPALVETIGKALRQSFDEVIDGPRTGRYKIEQLEKTEKTYIGTKVEIVLRKELELERGEILDNFICGHEVDTKFSISGNWMIPREAFGHICLLVSANDNNSTFNVGLLCMTPEVLTSGSNQDGKKSVSAYGKARILWVIEKATMPANLLLNLDDDIRQRIMSQSSGVQRMKELFRNVTGEIIPRTAIEQVAQQKDPLRRARQMKGSLEGEGIEVLCAKYETDRSKFEQYGFKNFNGDDWLSIKHRT